MGDVFDLDAVGREAEGEPFVFRFSGTEYTLPSRLDMRAAAAFSAGRLDDGLRTLLGPEQWGQLQAAEGLFDDVALSALLNAYAAHIGITIPESQASTSWPKSTAKS